MQRLLEILGELMNHVDLTDETILSLFDEAKTLISTEPNENGETVDYKAEYDKLKAQYIARFVDAPIDAPVDENGEDEEVVTDVTIDDLFDDEEDK